MHPYLPFLLEDIKAAHCTENVEDDQLISEVSGTESLLNILSKELLLAQDYSVPFSDYCGLASEQFPPVDQLDSQDIEKVCQAMEAMLSSWHAVLDYPDTMSLTLQYRLLVRILDEDFTPNGEGLWCFDFCSGYPPDCCLKDQCSCRKDWDDFFNQDAETEKGEE